jgi:hypothetical protein
MKLFTITFFFITVVGSAIVIAQTTEQETVKSAPQNFIVLERALANVDRSRKDRNSVLRLQRAEFYYHNAIKYHQAGWTAKALDYARRGTLLIELHQRSVAQPGFYRPELAAAQKTSLVME